MHSGATEGRRALDAPSNGFGILQKTVKAEVIIDD
jgi:hypothetical protein